MTDDALKTFAESAAGACETMLSKIPESKHKQLADVMKAGASMCISVTVDAYGNTAIKMELVGQSGRFLVASLVGDRYSLH